MSAKVLGGYWKLSFHPPAQSKDGNDSQFGPTKGYLEKLDTLELQRPPVIRWTRAPIEDEKSYACTTKIVFPTDHLGGPLILDENARLIDTAPAGHAIEVLVVFSKRPLFVRNGDLIYSGYVKGFDEYVSLVSRVAAFDNASLPTSGEYPGSLLDGAESHTQEPGPVNGIFFSTGTLNGKPMLSITELTGLSFTI